MKKINFGTIKKIGNILYWIILGFVFIVGIITLLSTTSSIKGMQLFSVSSGSMEPSISTGSLVIIFPRDEYKIDDVITYNPDPGNSQLTTTHRIQSIEVADENTFFTTKGDANSTPDADLINSKSVLGKVVLHVPYIGYLAAFTRTIQGMFLLIILPSILIIYDELNKIKVELGKIIRKKYENRIN